MTVLSHASRDFRLYYASFVVSTLGDAFRLLAVNVWIFQATDGSPLQRLALVLLGNLPGVLLGGVSGVLADRWDKYAVLVVSDVLRVCVGLGLAACAVTDQPLVALALVAVGNALGVFFTTSSFALLPRLVDGERLVRANGLLQTTQWMVQIVGPSLAAITLVSLGAPVAFLVDSVSFLMSAVILVRLRRVIRPGPRADAVEAAEPDVEAARVSAWASFTAGLRVVVAEPRVRALLLASYGVTFIAGCTNYSLIFLVTRSLGLDAASLGFVYSLNGAVAVAAGAATTAFFSKAPLGRIMTISILGLCVAQVLMGLAPNLWVLGVGVAVSAALNAPYIVSVTTLFMRIVPGEYLGRVEGVDTTIDNLVSIAAFVVSLAVVSVADARLVFLLSALAAVPSLVLAMVKVAPARSDEPARAGV